jgi:hypothetical protein
MNIKKCIKCKVLKPLVEYSSKGNYKKREQCKVCYNSNWKYRLMSTLSSRKAKNQKMPDGRNKKVHDVNDKINSSFLENLKNKQNGMCYWLNIPMDFTLKDKLRKPSLDRLDNSIGYNKDNIVLTTVFANTGRRDATLFEMSEFIKNYL